MTQMVERRFKRQLARALVLSLLVFLLVPPPSQAGAGLIWKVVWEVGKFLALNEAGNFVDKVFGRDAESQLKQYERELSERFQRAGTEERRRLQEELDLVRRQLHSLQKVLYGDLTPQEMAELRAKAREDIPRLQRLVQHQGARIDDLEGEMGDVKSRLGALEARLSLPSFGKLISFYAGAFTSASRNLPGSVADSARETLEAELSRDRRVRIAVRPAAVDTFIEGRVLRYSVDHRSYSDYNTRPRVTVFHDLEISLALTDSRGEVEYWSEVYRREAREFLPAGAHGSSSDFGVAHQLLRDAMKAAAADLVAFAFLEDPPPPAEEYVELDR